MSNILGTEARALRVGIIGSGPAGFYAAEGLFRSEIKVQVDMFDRLPTPFGLVRYGVAPDHPKIKNVIKVFEMTANRVGFACLGNVTVGEDIQIHELQEYYDALIFSFGCETERKLGIPGENLAGSHTATEFVAWYNGRPGYESRQFDLSGEVAVIIGQGNVSMDVSRILSKNTDELKNTDICSHALEVLVESTIKEVHLIGRRGPMQAAFTAPEIREFGELPNCRSLLYNPEDMSLNEASQKEFDDPKLALKRKNYEILQSFMSENQGNKEKKFFIHFFQSPIEIIGSQSIEKVILEKNELIGEAGSQKSRGTGIKTELPCDIMFRSVGYRGIPIPELPLTDQRGIIDNQGGRIYNSGKICPGLYCTGWIKRGPSGVIGTNKADSDDTILKLLEDLPNLKPCENPNSEELAKLLNARGVLTVNFEDWKRIDMAEIERCQKFGKPREKFTTIEDMLSACEPTISIIS